MTLLKRRCLWTDSIRSRHITTHFRTTIAFATIASSRSEACLWF
nr:MAG TPA: hypothetical protein [Caudoviricetes sp.]